MVNLFDKKYIILYIIIYQASVAKSEKKSEFTLHNCVYVWLYVYNSGLSNIKTQLDFGKWVAGLKTPLCFQCHKSTRVVCDKPW